MTNRNMPSMLVVIRFYKEDITSWLLVRTFMVDSFKP